MLKYFTIFLVASLIALNSYVSRAEDIIQGSTGGEAAKVGVAGSQFLKIGVGARGTGMAGAYGSLANDLTAIHWNPAGLADITGMSANFSHTEWIQGFRHSFGAVSLPIGSSYTFAVSAVTLSSDEIPITTIMNDDGKGATYSISDIAFGMTFSGYLTDAFSFGITAKYIDNSINALNANTFAFDIGTKYDVGLYGIKLGFSIHNLGSEMNYSGQDLSTSKILYEGFNASPLDVDYSSYAYGLPLIFRASVSSEIIKQEEHQLIAGLDFNTLSDSREQFAIGTEYTWNQLVSVRAGYIFNTDAMGLAAGVGINYLSGYFKGNFDYSINPLENLGLIHRFGINLNFGS